MKYCKLKHVSVELEIVGRGIIHHTQTHLDICGALDICFVTMCNKDTLIEQNVIYYEYLLAKIAAIQISTTVQGNHNVRTGLGVTVGYLLLFHDGPPITYV